MSQAMKILIAYDGSGYADDAITELQRAGLSNTAAGRVREIFPDWIVSAEARLGKPAWEVIQKSDEWQAELVGRGQTRKQRRIKIMD